jgi:hypothetical protein
MYEVLVQTDNTSNTQTISTSNTIGWNPYNTYDSYTTTLYWPTTVYMYQLKCPKCKKMNWGELDKVIECKQCRSSLKAVSKKVDFEIPIE